MRLLSVIPIIFEDKDILALDKPSGIPVHPDGKKKMFCVTDFLIEKYPDIRNVGEPMKISNGAVIERPGIVHRTDKDTSGILLVAKTPEGYKHLKEQFLNRTIKKTYHAFVYGDLKEERGIIDKPIGRSVGSVTKWTTSNIRGEKRDAVTKYKVLQSKKEASFLEVWPLTGRTHQIRVHLKSIHHPIICDPIYAPKQPELLGFKRLALHASRIIFKDLNGKEIEIEAPMPEDFTIALKQIKG